MARSSAVMRLELVSPNALPCSVCISTVHNTFFSLHEDWSHFRFRHCDSSKLLMHITSPIALVFGPFSDCPLSTAPGHFCGPTWILPFIIWTFMQLYQCSRCSAYYSLWAQRLSNVHKRGEYYVYYLLLPFMSMAHRVELSKNHFVVASAMLCSGMTFCKCKSSIAWKVSLNIVANLFWTILIMLSLLSNARSPPSQHPPNSCTQAHAHPSWSKDAPLASQVTHSGGH